MTALAQEWPARSVAQFIRDFLSSLAREPSPGPTNRGRAETRGGQHHQRAERRNRRGGGASHRDCNGPEQRWKTIGKCLCKLHRHRPNMVDTDAYGFPWANVNELARQMSLTFAYVSPEELVALASEPKEDGIFRHDRGGR